MKKLIAALLTILPLMLSSCGDISDAEAAKSFFAMNYDDCTLCTIEYNDAHNEQVREDNLWEFRCSFEPKSLTDVLELSVTYYDNQDSDNTNSLITETYYMVTLDNGNWEVGDHGRT